MRDYIDIQVNGYAGVDFNQDGLTQASLDLACERLEGDRVSGILATIITDDLDLMCARLKRLAVLRSASESARRMILGFHIEGPFISAVDGYRGAHPLDAVRPADIDAMKRLVDASQGLTRLVTLAPECDPGSHVTDWLARQGIIVSAGHCDPSLDTLKAAVDAGLGMFTHLGNGCPMHIHRHDNIIQRALSLADRIRLCFIADGVHVPFSALSNYLRLAGIDRCIVVTDAMAAAGLGPGRHRLGRWEVDVGDDLAAWAPDRSHLVGSAISMPQCYDNLTTVLGYTDAQARRLVRDNPMSVLQISNDLSSPPGNHVKQIGRTASPPAAPADHPD